MGLRETTLEADLAAVAARQAGHLTTAQARAAGRSQKVVSRRLDNGLWVRCIEACTASPPCPRPGVATCWRRRLRRASEPSAPTRRRAGQLWAAASLPQPRWNVAIVTPNGRRYVVDALFPGRLITELEELRFHTAPQQRRDAARCNDLTLAGHRVLRFTWRDIVEDRERVVAEIRDALAARGVWT